VAEEGFELSRSNFALLLLLAQSHYAAQAGLEFKILLPLPHECWDYRKLPTQLRFFA
jgi:hypothetical protein